MAMFTITAPPDAPPTLVVAANVRNLMEHFGVSQQQLAAWLGVSQQAVSKRLRGMTPWDVNECGVLAARFGLQAGDLMDGELPSRLPHLDSNQEPAG